MGSVVAVVAGIDPSPGYPAGRDSIDNPCLSGRMWPYVGSTLDVQSTAKRRVW